MTRPMNICQQENWHFMSLVVHLTWLSDGGATLAVGFNHCLCDGIGSDEFLLLVDL